MYCKTVHSDPKPNQKQEMKVTESSQNDLPLRYRNKEEKMASDKGAETKLLRTTDSVVHIRLPFVHKLYLMLNDMEAKGYDHIVSWIGDGKAFKIHDPSLFESSIQPQYFRQSRVASFIRQCYGYGFAKIEDKSNVYFGAYVHPDFQRDDPTRACTIQRRTGSTLGSDRRFKTTTQPAANDDQIRNSGNNVISDLHESFCSLGTWQSSCDKKPEVMLDSDWNTVSPTIVSVKGSDSVLPRHVSPQDDWLAELQLVFASSPAMQDAASPSKGMLSFVEFKSLFEPRPIEFMIHR